MTREEMIDEAVRHVESCYPRTMRLLLDGHANGEPLGQGNIRCIACADNVAAIRAKFLAIERRERKFTKACGCSSEWVGESTIRWTICAGSHSLFDDAT